MIVSNSKPIRRTDAISERTGERFEIINTAKATDVVPVIVSPVFTAPFILSGIGSSLPDLRTRDVSRRSVSTEYPISIRRAANVGRERLIPRTFITAIVSIMSVTAAAITAIDGAKVLNNMNTTIPMRMKETIRPNWTCWKKEAPKAAPTVLTDCFSVDMPRDCNSLSICL